MRILGKRAARGGLLGTILSAPLGNCQDAQLRKYGNYLLRPVDGGHSDIRKWPAFGKGGMESLAEVDDLSGCLTCRAGI